MYLETCELISKISQMIWYDGVLTTLLFVTTQYDCTKQGIDGTEISYVMPNGIMVSGYCQDNIITQHIDDEIRRSPNGANASFRLKSVILYRVTRGNKEAIYGERTKSIWNVSDTHSWFSFMLESTTMVVEELKTLGKERVDDSIISNLKNRLPEAEKGELLEEVTGVSEWICLCFLKGWRLNKYL